MRMLALVDLLLVYGPRLLFVSGSVIISYLWYCSFAPLLAHEGTNTLSKVSIYSAKIPHDFPLILL